MAYVPAEVDLEAQIEIGIDAHKMAEAYALHEAYAIGSVVLQRPQVATLSNGQVARDVPLVTQGELVAVESAPVRIGERTQTWDWGLLMLGEVAVVVVMPEIPVDLTIGNQARLIGHYVGRMPVAGGHPDQRVAVILGKRMFMPDDDTDGPGSGLLEAGIPDALVDPSRPGIQDELFARIDDEEAILEARPYYYMLYTVDRADAWNDEDYSDAPSALEMREAILAAPQDLRNTPMRVEGMLLRAWEDHMVARDQPYGIERVVRLFLFNRIYGEREVEVYSPTGTYLRTETETGVMPVIFEVAVITDKAIPNVRERPWIRSVGRFLKVHGIPSARSDDHTAEAIQKQQRHSEYNYYPLFVARDFEVEEGQETDTFWWSAAFLVIAFSFLVWISIMIHRDNRRRGVAASVRRLRTARRRWQQREHAQADDATATGPGGGDSEAAASDTDGEPTQQ